MASKWYGKERLREIENLLEHKMTLAAEFVKDEAKRLCPVDTGNLERSLDKEVKKENGEVIGRIGTNVDYAARVEYGFSGFDSLGRFYDQPSQSYLRRALVSNKQQIMEFLGGTKTTEIYK